MARDHFSQYQQAKPKEYEAFSNNLWNGFVSITKHVPVLNRFFSFTPEILSSIDEDQATDLGAALGEVYNLSKGITNEAE